jgi:hypothetical protein
VPEAPGDGVQVGARTARSLPMALPAHRLQIGQRPVRRNFWVPASGVCHAGNVLIFLRLELSIWEC